MQLRGELHARRRRFTAAVAVDMVRRHHAGHRGRPRRGVEDAIVHRQ